MASQRFDRARANASTNISGTPLQRKLGATPGQRVGLIGAPAGLADQLDGVEIVERLGGRFEVIVFFARTRGELERRLPALLRAREERGSLWLAWPKRASGVPSDLDDIVVRELGLASGLVDNKVCAIDETWSGLRFVARRRAGDDPRPVQPLP
jgi:hypothetical protein